ncbi:glycosyltransferase, partial [Klebsiella pneumoniae]|nr:glycosyltransferase [Klebsiella pneumoniae]
MTGGGAERTALAVARALSADGHAVDLVVSDVRGELLADPFVQAHLVPLGRRDPLLTIGAYLRYLRRHRPAVVIALVHSANFV